MSSNNENKDTFTSETTSSETTSSETTSSETTSSTTLNPLNKALALRSLQFNEINMANLAEIFRGISPNYGINTKYKNYLNDGFASLAKLGLIDNSFFDEQFTVIKKIMEIEEAKKLGLNTYYNLDCNEYIKLAFSIQQKTKRYINKHLARMNYEIDTYTFSGEKHWILELLGDLNDNEINIYNNIIKNGLDTPEINKILDTLREFILYFGHIQEAGYYDVMRSLYSGYNVFMYTAYKIIEIQPNYTILKERATDAYNKMASISENYLRIYQILLRSIQIANNKIFNLPLRPNINFAEVIEYWKICWAEIYYDNIVIITYALVLQLATNIAFNYKTEAELTAEEAYNKLTESEKAIYDEMKK